MRRLWQDHLGTGYTEADFQKIVESIAGPEVVSWLVRLIHSTEELDYAPLLETYGLQFKPAKIPAADDTQEVFLGADAAMVDGRLTVKRIQRDSPAYRAGLNVDDEWIALNDFRVGNDWNDRLLLHQPGDEVQLLISRRNKLMRLPVRLAAKPSANWKLETVPTATPEQKTQLAQWLQLEPDPKNDAVQQPSGAENAK
jgi:predicted metalloprotease with PDZ domain